MRRRWMVAAGAVLLVVLGLVGWQASWGPPAEGTEQRVDGGFSLVPPAFAQAAPAKSFLESEAGICAYYNLGQEIDLSRARRVFRGIEADEADYLIGTVALPDLAEDMWPHMYITKTGWLVAFYSRIDPTSKLMQWIGYQADVISTTTLRDALILACQQMALDPSAVGSGLKYYHFQYPDATRMVIAVDTVADGGDAFTYTIPAGLALYEASLSHRYIHRQGQISYCSSSVFVDGEDASSSGGCASYVSTRALKPQYATPGVRHGVSLSASYGWTGAAVFFLFRG